MKQDFSILSAPAQRALANKGIDSVEKLAQYSEKELFKLHGIGKKTIPKLNSLLEKHHLTFKK